jgi:hypothetical protein
MVTAESRERGSLPPVRVLGNGGLAAVVRSGIFSSRHGTGP